MSGAGLEGGNARILLPLSQHAQNTLQSLGRLHPQGSLKISPFCHEHPEGAHEVRGWCLDTPGSAPGSCLPINCSMFDGVSIVKCEGSEAEILELLTDAEDTRRRLGEAIHEIMKLTVLEETRHLRASWKRCRPTLNGTPQSLCSASVTLSSSASTVNFFNTQDCVPIIDSEHWIPELSPEGFVGLYHHWNHSGSSGLDSANGLSLYIVCQSYLPKACLEFADMVRDLGDACTASEVYHSEEAHWLRQACARNRCRLIAAVCQLMQLKFPAMLDYNGCKTCLCHPVAWRSDLMAISCVETLQHDIQSIPIVSREETETIRILNFCASPHASTNAAAHSVCIMAPWEGVWVFHHANTNTRGDASTILLFPTITPKIAEQDHIALKQKRLASPAEHHSPSIFAFASNIPEVCDALNIFWAPTPGLKKKKSKKSWKSKRDASSLALRRTLAMQEMNEISTSSMLTMTMVTMDKRELDTMKQLMVLREGAPPCENHSETTLIGDDIMQAYKQSIAKLTSLVLNHHSVPKSGPKMALRKQTYLSFDENVLQAMERQGWKRNRSSGYTALIPLACGFSDHWKRFMSEDHLSDLPGEPLTGY